MKLLFKQRMFSWLDSYDVYYENGDVAYFVKGEIAFGHMFRVYDCFDNPIGAVKQRIFTWLPKFEIYIGDSYMGCISRELTFLRPRYNIDFNGWHIEGNLFEWDYAIVDSYGSEVARISKEIWEWTDTYVIDVKDPLDALHVLMFVIAMDADKCTNND